MSDKERGLKVFRAFWNWNRTFNRSFTLSFDEFLKSYGKKTDIYLDGVGGMIRETDLSDSQIDTAMRSMAQKSKGQIPKFPFNAMVPFLNNQAATVDWMAAVTETAEDLLDGAVEIGNSVITTGRIINFLLPVIALVILYYILNKKTEGQFSKAFKGLRK